MTHDTCTPPVHSALRIVLPQDLKVTYCRPNENPDAFTWSFRKTSPTSYRARLLSGGVSDGGSRRRERGCSVACTVMHTHPGLPALTTIQPTQRNSNHLQGRRRRAPTQIMAC
ncbi:hypothetical protein PoB_002369700 [Plakobranchus ocellatus]|uniref:Uncharacterized protein n=1 Tax=Plakobranchus ocellatus TaxID=259542 RepID=A0AAV3ZRP2_9GAST|nr:hypothetical protein PoB_002369700 [Plakobranchus ocellatus]